MNEKFTAEQRGAETAEGLIARVKELLDDNLFDDDARDECLSDLRTARLLTQNTLVIKKIDELITNIELRYR